MAGSPPSRSSRAATRSTGSTTRCTASIEKRDLTGVIVPQADPRPRSRLREVTPKEERMSLVRRLTSPRRRWSAHSTRSAPSSAPTHVLTGDDMREFRDPFWHLRLGRIRRVRGRAAPIRSRRSRRSCGIANEHRVPLWTTSQGRNNGYGGSSPRVHGSVVVNLRRMNRVLEIDEELGYAVVEPGVSWFDLYAAIPAGGHDADALLRRPGLGQRDRQHARPRLHLPALRRRLRRAVRHGGRARQRRAACAPAWARCRTTAPGTSTSAASGRRPTSSSCSPTSGSSRRWACG